MDKTYRFMTDTTMKAYNRDKWWISSDIVKTFETTAATLSEAIKAYQAFVADTAYITISNNALRTKSPMYIDTPSGAKQVGYVLTGSTDFQNSENYRWSKQYIDLWVSISELKEIDFA